MITVTITLTGPDVQDAVYSLDVVREKLEDDFTSGFEQNERGGSYSFVVEGEEEDAQTPDQ